ncbi:hypothetical protein [Dactylosporangium sp. NPDC048998]|uniref:hypothetical protein n=1 Tax=Dactylosporangium sp. NPDC048998 TaxID=3363976 RepID=UPI0037246CC6
MRRADSAVRTAWQPALTGGLLAAALLAVLAAPADRPHPPAAAPSAQPERSAATATHPTAAPPESPGGRGAAADPDTVCTISDPRAVGLSGLLATATGYLVQNDRTPNPPSVLGVFVLDHACAVTATVTYPGDTVDPEDLAIAPDGTVWVADTGDTDITHPQRRRATITLWRLPDPTTIASGTASAPEPYLLRYADGPHDAEALLFDGDNRPILVTKDATGRAGLYTTGGPLRPGPEPGLLQRVGTFRPVRTGTRNPFGSLGTEVVTGAAVAPDRSWVTLRTYADAYTWQTANRDLLTAITTDTPTITPLPNEPKGEAIAASSDGLALLTISDQPGPTRLLRYTPTAWTSTWPADAAPSPTAPRTAGPAAGPATPSRLPHSTDLTAAVIFGLVMISVGLLGIHLARRRAEPVPAATSPPAGRPGPDPPPLPAQPPPADDNAYRPGSDMVDLATVRPARRSTTAGEPDSTPGAGP